MKISGMRRFSKKSRLQADSVTDVTRPFVRITLDLSEKITFDDGQLKPGHLLNALIHAFNGLPESQQQAIATEAIAQLELLLVEDDGERVRVMNKMTAPTKNAWLAGSSVRDLTASEQARQRERTKGGSVPQAPGPIPLKDLLIGQRNHQEPPEAEKPPGKAPRKRREG